MHTPTLALTFLCGCASVRIPPPADGSIQDATVDCTETTCALNFSLRLEDFEGEPYTESLNIDDFWVEDATLSREDGQPAPTILRAEPADVAYLTLGDHLCAAILLDQSGSIRTSDPHDARLTGARGIVTATLSDGTDPDRLALLAFPRVYASLGALESTDIWLPFTNDRDLLSDTLDDMADGEGNQTPIYDSIIEAAEYLYTDPESVGATRALLVMTDGEDTDSLAETADVLERVIDLEVPLYIVGLGTTADFSDLKRLAIDSGGLFSASDVESLDETFAALSEVLYSNVRMTIHTAFQKDSPPLEVGAWYRITGTLHYGHALSIPVDERFFVGDLSAR